MGEAHISISIHRIYDRDTQPEGYRILVDRVWPRGVRKESVHLDAWLKELAPSTALRKWFAHDPTRWDEFRRRYLEELAEQEEAVERLRAIAQDRNLVLLYGAKDTAHNQAVVLREVLETGASAHTESRQ